MDVKNAVAENIPAFCKNFLRFVAGMMICFYKSSEIKPHPITTLNVVNSDSSLLQERGGRVSDINESCWGEVC
jgi:hypothetical protein